MSSASSAERLGTGVGAEVAVGSGVAAWLGDADGEAATDGAADGDPEAGGVGVTEDEHAATVASALTRINRRKERIGDLGLVGLRNAGTTKHASQRLRRDLRQVTRLGMDERRHRAAPDARSGTICAWPP